MLSLTRKCHPTQRIPESRIRVADQYWVWIKAIHHNARAITLSLNFDALDMPEMTMDLNMNSQLRIGESRIDLVKVTRAKCVLRFDAPASVIILREELL